MTYCDLCLPIFKNNYQQMATFRIFRRVQFEHTSNAMFCNFPLNFAVWPQPSRFLKAEIQICAFLWGFAPCLQGFAPCLRACFGPECINLLLKLVAGIGERRTQAKSHENFKSSVQLQLSKESHFHKKTGWRDGTSTSGDKIMAVFLGHHAQMGH